MGTAAYSRHWLFLGLWMIVIRALKICQIFPLKYTFIPQEKIPLFPNAMQNILYNIEYSSTSLHIFPWI